jgi:hypothetical protein
MGNLTYFQLLDFGPQILPILLYGKICGPFFTFQIVSSPPFPPFMGNLTDFQLLDFGPQILPIQKYTKVFFAKNSHFCKNAKFESIFWENPQFSQ